MSLKKEGRMDVFVSKVRTEDADLMCDAVSPICS